MGPHHTCCLTESGQILTFGLNSCGQVLLKIQRREKDTSGHLDLDTMMIFRFNNIISSVGSWPHKNLSLAWNRQGFSKLILTLVDKNAFEGS